MCTLDGNHLTTFDNRTMRVTFDDVGPNYIFGYCHPDTGYGISMHTKCKRYINWCPWELGVFLRQPYNHFTMKFTWVYGEGWVLGVTSPNGPIEVPTNRWLYIYDFGITRSKDNEVTLKWPQDSPLFKVIFDGYKKRIKVVGSDRLPGNLSGICGDVSGKKVADNPSPGKCESHHHEIVDTFSLDEICFSRIPVLECGSRCHSVGLREKRVSFTCMAKDDRVTQHMAMKVRRGDVLPELGNMPEAYSVKKTVPVECRPYPTYGSNSSTFDNSLF